MKVRVWALNTLTGTLGVCVCVVETTEPLGTDISRKGPFADPDVVFEVPCVGNISTVFIAVLADVAMWTLPREVLMSVHDNIFVVIISKKIVPDVCIEVEGVVEDEFDVWVLLVNHRPHIPVEVFEDIKV